MSRIVSIDGSIVAPEDAKVSVYDRGFLYGDSVFETIRTYDGAPFALDEHIERLERSAERVAIAMPAPAAQIADEVKRAIAAAGNAESYARVMLTRGSGPMGLDPSLASGPLRVIMIEPLTPLPASMYRDGVAVVTVQTERPSDAAQGAKVGNYLTSLLALRAAREAGAHEALIVNKSGQVVEGTTSNAFIVRGGALITPPEQAGILAGITRAHVLAAAVDLGIPVKLEQFTPDEMAAADEAFISSSLREVLPVVRVDGKVVGEGSEEGSEEGSRKSASEAGRPGRVTRALHAAFRKRSGLRTSPMPWE